MLAWLPLFQGVRSWGVTELPLNCRSKSDQKAIREQLDRILKSGPFLHAPRRQRFLQYIVNETLAGRGERLKGYSIAQEVFDRSDAFDPNVDPIVRVEAPACVTSFASTTVSTGEATLFALICQRAVTRRTSSFGRRQYLSLSQNDQMRRLQIDTWILRIRRLRLRTSRLRRCRLG
jgi:hypothetical protein